MKCYATILSLFTPLVSSKFEFLPEIFLGPFLPSTTLGYNIRAERVYSDCLITIPDKVSYAEVIELTVIDFYINFGYRLAM